MKYIEIIIAVNLLIHLSFVKVSYYLLKMKINHLSTAISCIFDGAYIFLYLLYPYELEPFKYICIFIISIVPFITKGISKALILMLVYLMLNFTLGGSSEVLFQIVNHFYGVLICLGLMLIIIFIYNLFKRFHFDPNKLEFKILIEENNKKYYLKGFCDTGNFLCDDENISIVFINKKFLFGKYVKNLIVRSVSTLKEVRLYKVDSFKIKIKNKYIKKDVYLAYGDIVFDVMFGSNLLGG